MKNPSNQLKLHLNLLKDIEETNLRLQLKKAAPTFKLELLVAFRPGATLRQLNNTRIANIYGSQDAQENSSLL